MPEINNGRYDGLRVGTTASLGDPANSVSYVSASVMNGFKSRGFEPVSYLVKDDQRVFNFGEVTLPSRATAKSAGYDFCALEDVTIKAGEIKLVPTGVKAYMHSNEMLVLANRSSNPKKGLILANGIGIIDADYYSNANNDGHIFFAFHAIKDVEIKAGDKIGQGYFTYYLTADRDNATAQRTGGFGSTNG